MNDYKNIVNNLLTQKCYVLYSFELILYMLNWENYTDFYFC